MENGGAACGLGGGGARLQPSGKQTIRKCPGAVHIPSAGGRGFQVQPSVRRMWTADWGRAWTSVESTAQSRFDLVQSRSAGNVGFWTGSRLPVDSLLNGRHESNQPSNNY